VSYIGKFLAPDEERSHLRTLNATNRTRSAPWIYYLYSARNATFLYWIFHLDRSNRSWPGHLLFLNFPPWPWTWIFDKCFFSLSVCLPLTHHTYGNKVYLSPCPQGPFKLGTQITPCLDRPPFFPPQIDQNSNAAAGCLSPDAAAGCLFQINFRFCILSHAWRSFWSVLPHTEESTLSLVTTVGKLNVSMQVSYVIVTLVCIVAVVVHTNNS